MSKKVKIKLKSGLKSGLKNGFPRTTGTDVRKIIANILLGLSVVFVGVAYLGNQIPACPWSNFTLFFPGWGSLFLIVPAVYGLIRKPLSWWWAVCLLVGVLILLSKQEAYSFATAASIVLAAAVILVGLRILLSPLFKRAKQKRMRRQWQRLMGESNHVLFGEAVGGENSDGVYTVHLGDRTVTIENREFTSATVSCNLGNMVFNIQNATIPRCAVIDATCRCGNLEILLPAHVRVEIGGSFRLGNLENRHIDATAEDAPIVYINIDGSGGNVAID